MGGREWDREMEMDEDVWDGFPVHEDYRDPLHAPVQFHSSLIPLFADAEFIGGWDAGSASIRPAFVALQVLPKIGQIHALFEVTSDTPTHLEAFCPLVQAYLYRYYPSVWRMFEHFSDETCRTRTGPRGESNCDIAESFGITLNPVSNMLEGRLSAVDRALRGRLTDNSAQFVLSAHGCPVLRQGFQGAYQNLAASTGDASGPGSVLRNPLKNVFSHVQDALQAGMIAAWERIRSREIVESQLGFIQASAEPDESDAWMK